MPHAASACNAPPPPTAYPQILREFTGVGEMLSLDLLFGKFYLTLNRAGILEVWQAMPQIKALEYIILPPDLGTLTLVLRIRVSGGELGISPPEIAVFSCRMRGAPTSSTPHTPHTGTGRARHPHAPVPGAEPRGPLRPGH